MTSTETQKLIEAVHDGGEALWAGRTASLLEALDGTGVNLASDTLLDDVIAAGESHTKVSQFLVGLPGHPSDPAEAIKQLGYLVDMATAAQVRVADDERGELTDG